MGIVGDKFLDPVVTKSINRQRLCKLSAETLVDPFDNISLDQEQQMCFQPDYAAAHFSFAV